jgi:hypothetical protein
MTSALNKSFTSDIFHIWKGINSGGDIIGLNIWVDESLGNQYRYSAPPDVHYVLELIGNVPSRDVFAHLIQWVRWILIYHIYWLKTPTAFSDVDNLFKSAPIIMFSDDDELWDYILKINNTIQKYII